MANDVLGYLLHTPLLVPYFAWQWSHHVHHSKCNHLTEGESHVPFTDKSPKAAIYLKMRDIIGVESFSIWQLLNILIIGWPAYIIFGATAGPGNNIFSFLITSRLVDDWLKGKFLVVRQAGWQACIDIKNKFLLQLLIFFVYFLPFCLARGFSSHLFVPNGLFHKDKVLKVHISNIGVVAVVYALYLWAKSTSFTYVIAMYCGPYLVINAYLTLITFLQHVTIQLIHQATYLTCSCLNQTEDYVPHYDASAWSWLKGALCTIDRNYPEFINALHYDIGSTHVVHHIFHEMPHFNAREANVYLKQIIGTAYYHDKKSIP